MQVGIFELCGVEMPDAGSGPPAPKDRRASNAEIVGVYDSLGRWARAAAAAGYDSLWLAEHHFQTEGYEVVPNILLVSSFLAGQTQRLKFGPLVHVVPQWH